LATLIDFKSGDSTLKSWNFDEGKLKKLYSNYESPLIVDIIWHLLFSWVLISLWLKLIWPAEGRLYLLLRDINDCEFIDLSVLNCTILKLFLSVFVYIIS
jgi:hypothetical protein